MGFNRFNIMIGIQLVLILLSSFFIALALTEERFKVTIIYIGVIILIQVYFLFRSITKNNRNLLNLFQSLKSNDVTSKLPQTAGGKPFKELSRLLNEFIDELGQVRLDKEKEHDFFKNTIKHVNTGLLAFNENREVKLANETLLKMFNIPELKNIRKLNSYFVGFEQLLIDIRPGKSQTIRFFISNIQHHLSLKCSEFVIDRSKLKLISFHDIKSEFAQEEAETWHKLISVLRHEIMNSVGPITSLVSTLVEEYEERVESEPDSEVVKSTLTGLKAIEKRSVGLVNFVEEYKKLSILPKPVLSQIKPDDLLNEIASLMKSKLADANIEFTINNRFENIYLNADEKLISQILLNLVNNSFMAMRDSDNKQETKQAYISIRTVKMSGQSLGFEVEDNGSGIHKNLYDKIFIPFFTTRKDGSGIGLSLCRQIMKLHGGTISVQSNPGIKTIFTLRF